MATPRDVNRHPASRVKALTGDGIPETMNVSERKRSNDMSKLLTTLIAIAFAAAASTAVAQAPKGDTKSAPAAEKKSDAKKALAKPKGEAKKGDTKKAPAKPKGEAKKGDTKKKAEEKK
jgi:hypothetical protein